MGDVVYHQKSVRFEIGCCPKPAIFFLTGGIGDGEEVIGAVDVAGYGVGVLCRLLVWYSHCGCIVEIPIVGSYLIRSVKSGHFLRIYPADLLMHPLTAHKSQCN